MDQAALQQRLMSVFLGELEEHVQALNDGLLALEKKPTADEGAEQLKRLFRAAHSLKGAAGTVGVRLIETACHSLEDILGKVRDGSIMLDPERFETIYAAADAIADAGARLRAKQDLHDAPIAAIGPRLAVAARPTNAAESPTPAPRLVSEEHAEVQHAEPQPIEHAQQVGRAIDAGLVRVPVAKLDDMLARGGELLLARSRLEERAHAVETIHDFAEDWLEEWSAVEHLVSELGRGESTDTGNGSQPFDQLRACLPMLGRASDKLRRLERDLERLGKTLAQDARALNAVTGGLDDELRSIRMLPLSEACAGLERLVRDLARASGKSVDLSIQGGQIELDRTVLEGIKDPLVHLVRNAIDHGIELPQERLAAGKSPRGQVVISAALHGSRVEVVVSDDGRGLDLEAIRTKARKNKLAVPADDADVAQLIFQPGLSTAQLITEISGRGVGLDVVRSQVARLNGSVEASIDAERGARFTLMLPLTLTSLRALLVRVNGRIFIFDTAFVRRVLSIAPEDVRTIEGGEVILAGATPVPVVSLAAVLGLPPNPSTLGKTPVVILAQGEQEAAIAVDEVIAEQEVFVKNLGARLTRVGYVTSATIMPNGSVALKLSAADLLGSVHGQGRARTLGANLGESAPPRKRLLVVDDSITTRTMMHSVLDAGGYEVSVAVDGAEAWATLQEGDADLDLVVSDVEMPRMDGFALTQAIRASSRHADLPVVLVTARSTDQDKARGMEVGANAYLVKSTFDHKTLLAAIAQLL